MDRSRWKQIDAIFERMLEIEPDRRAEALAEACAGDQALRREVEELLAQMKSAEVMLGYSVIAEAVGQTIKECGALEIGQKINHYTVKARIGQGGMGQVWLAKDDRLGRDVAIKILPPEFSANADRVRRFEQEALTVSALNHPNIITIHDTGQADGLHFIVTEYINGSTLRQHLTAGSLPLHEALEIASAIARALAAAHKVGIVHRDIKPENVMLWCDGLVKVLDFGLAKPIEQQENTSELAPFVPTSASRVKTEAGRVMGTSGYMSPEQVAGGEVDARSDFFSLGVVLYEMVAGQAPFTGATRMAIDSAIQRQQPTPLACHVPGLPKEVQRIVSRALNKHRAERYQTASELLRDLNMVQEQLPRPALRVTGLAWGKAALFVALLAIALVWGWQRLGRWDGTDRTPQITRLFANGKVEEADVSPDGQFVVFTAYKGKERGLMVVELATSKETELVPPAAGHDCRWPTFAPDGRSIYYLAYDERPQMNQLYQVPAGGGAPRRINEWVDSPVACAPDGRRLAFVRVDRERRETSLWVIHADGQAARRLAARQEPSRIAGARPAWSPDGERVAFAAGVYNQQPDYQVYQVSAAGGAEQPLSAHKWRVIEHLVWFKDDSGLALLAAPASDAPSQVWHLTFAYDRRNKLTDLPCNKGALGLTSNGGNLVAVQHDEVRGLWVMPGTDERRAVKLATGENAGRHGIAWTPDHEIIYAGGTRLQPQLWRIGLDDNSHQRFSFDALDDSGPTVSPDGLYIVYSSVRARDGGNQIWRMDRAGSNHLQLSFGKFDVDPECSTDGKWVVYVSWDKHPQAAIWKVPIDGGAATQLTAGHTTNPSPALSPDGRRLAYIHSLQGEQGKWVEIVPFDDLASASRPPRRIALSDRVGMMQWSPDGRALDYTEVKDGVTNLWRLPLDGRPRRQLTDFKSDRISWFAWSNDGRQLALSRNTVSRDVIRISDFK